MKAKNVLYCIAFGILMWGFLKGGSTSEPRPMSVVNAENKQLLASLELGEGMTMVSEYSGLIGSHPRVNEKYKGAREPSYYFEHYGKQLEAMGWEKIRDVGQWQEYRKGAYAFDVVADNSGKFGDQTHISLSITRSW